MGQHINAIEMIEAVIFTKVNMVNALGGALLVAMFSVVGALQDYIVFAGAVSITALAAYNVVKFIRLLRGKEKDEEEWG